MKDDDMGNIMEDDVEELGEAPNAQSDRRYPSPTRAPATKRKKNVHLSEPATKRSIVGDLTDDEIDQDMDSLRAKQEDMKIVGRAILGHSVEEVYSNQRIQLAVTRQTVESMKLMSVDVTEIFSPERVAAVCREFNLRPGMSMDIKSGFDFDKKSDRDRCWDAIKKDKPSLVIGSPPCTLFSKLQELNKFM